MRKSNINMHIAGDQALELLKTSSRRWTMLTREEEIELGRRVRDHDDAKARDRLVATHIRLVMKMAAGMMGYGLPYDEIVAQGMIGLMKAVDRFDPEQESRFSTYSIWWIRSEITQYVLNNWSMVKVGTTAGQKTLFFKLRRAKSRLGITKEGDLTAQETADVAEATGTTESEVTMMNRRIGMGGDASLNVTIRGADGEQSGDWMDHLVSGEPSPYDDAADARRRTLPVKHVKAAMAGLSERERDIVEARHFGDEVMTLEELGTRYDVSRERIRQIEAKALLKIKRHLERVQRDLRFDLLAA